MNLDRSLVEGATYLELVMAAATIVSLLVVSAPYGRHARKGFGPTVPARLGWVLMESPSVLLFGAIFFTGAHRFEAVPLAFLAMWWFHYLNRAFVFPARLPPTSQPMPLLVAALGMGFNFLNSVVNAGWIGHVGQYDSTWLADPRFWLGLGMFGLGFGINHRSDMRLLALRKPVETGYKLPKGGLHEWVSSPNYLGEIVEWFGWAVATWSLSGLAFALYTVANLAPRAWQHHQWYRQKFPDYPPQRRALIPFVW